MEYRNSVTKVVAKCRLLRALCIIRLSFLLLPPSSIGIQYIHCDIVTQHLFYLLGIVKSQRLAFLLAPKATIVVAPFGLAALPLVTVQFYIK